MPVVALMGQVGCMVMEDARVLAEELNCFRPARLGSYLYNGTPFRVCEQLVEQALSFL